MQTDESKDKSNRGPLASSGSLPKRWHRVKAIMGGVVVTTFGSIFGMVFVSQIVGSLIRPDIIGGNIAYPQRGWAFWYVLSVIVLLSVALGYLYVRQRFNGSAHGSGRPT